MAADQINRFSGSIMGLSALGASFAVVGAAKIVDHVQSASPFSGTICSGSGEPSSAGSMFVDAAHCWGCPAAALGVALMLAATVIALRGGHGSPAFQAA